MSQYELNIIFYRVRLKKYILVEIRLISLTQIKNGSKSDQFIWPENDTFDSLINI